MTMPTALTHRASIKHCTRNSPTSILSVRQYGGHTRAMSDGGLDDREVMRLYRNEASPGNMHFEFGRDVGAPMPYKQHRFVYISPEGTKAHFGDITLLIWSRMCNYFSNNTIQTDAAADDKDTTTFRQHYLHRNV